MKYDEWKDAGRLTRLANPSEGRYSEVTKKDLLKALEHVPDECEILIMFFDDGYEAWVRRPAKGVDIAVQDDMRNWTLSIRGLE